jgi:hypothetical protein
MGGQCNAELVVQDVGSSKGAGRLALGRLVTVMGNTVAEPVAVTPPAAEGIGGRG